MKKVVLLAFAALGLAEADIIPVLVGSGGVNCGIQNGAWGCDYNYTATLHDNAKLTASQVEFEEYFTIYDFNGFVSATAPGGGALWLITTQNVGITPSRINGSTFDDPTNVNVTFTYTGAADVLGGTNLGTFVIRSQFGPAVMMGDFSSQVTNAFNNTWVQNTGQVEIPVPYRSDIGEIPEPMTMALIGSGLAGIGLVKRLRR